MLDNWQVPSTPIYASNVLNKSALELQIFQNKFYSNTTELKYVYDKPSHT